MRYVVIEVCTWQLQTTHVRAIADPLPIGAFVHHPHESRRVLCVAVSLSICSVHWIMYVYLVAHDRHCQ